MLCCWRLRCFGTRSYSNSGFRAKVRHLLEHGMMRLKVLLCLALTVSLGHSETRWCEVTGVSDDSKLTYPPIAKAARVSGAVIGRVQFVPGRGVTGFQPVFGPPMLAHYAGEQLKSWSLRTPAQGDEPCQTLLVATYHLMEATSEAGSPVIRAEPGVLKASVEAAPVILSDPAFQVEPGFGIRYLLRRMRRLFAGHSA